MVVDSAIELGLNVVACHCEEGFPHGLMARGPREACSRLTLSYFIIIKTIQNLAEKNNNQSKPRGAVRLPMQLLFNIFGPEEGSFFHSPLLRHLQVHILKSKRSGHPLMNDLLAYVLALSGCLPNLNE